MGTQEQRNSGYTGTVGTEEQWVQRNRGTVGTEEQRNSEYAEREINMAVQQ